MKVALATKAMPANRIENGRANRNRTSVAPHGPADVIPRAEARCGPLGTSMPGSSLGFQMSVKAGIVLICIDVRAAPALPYRIGFSKA